MTPAERKRLSRQRKKAMDEAFEPGAMLYETPDWQEFLDPNNLPRKAGCLVEELPALVLKELVDNGLDAGADVELSYSEGGWLVSDNGPGIAPEDVPRLFAVNRPLLSSKRKRLPARGMLGNGLRVIMAYAGKVVVISRGHTMSLAVDPVTGFTKVENDKPTTDEGGLMVWFRGSNVDPADRRYADETIRLAKYGKTYSGPSLPSWYGKVDFARLIAAAPKEQHLGDVVSDLGLRPRDRGWPLSTIGPTDVDIEYDRLRQAYPPIPQNRIIAEFGSIGKAAYPDTEYVCKVGTRRIEIGNDVSVPFVIEVWAAAEQRSAMRQRGQGKVLYKLILNRSSSLAHLEGGSAPNQLVINGCGLSYALDVPAGVYVIRIAVTTPHVKLYSDGKSPDLSPYRNEIYEAVAVAAKRAKRKADNPDDNVAIREACFSIMAKAFAIASGKEPGPDGLIHGYANQRQVYYPARRLVMDILGSDKPLTQAYFRVLLPEFQRQYADLTRHWEVLYDSRGTIIEPHTERTVPLGTVEVEDYINETPPTFEVALGQERLFRTIGPRNRYHNVIYIEKEGFHEQLIRSGITKRFDIALMSTKGQSPIAARRLLDALAPYIDNVYVLHDLDISGFTINRTLTDDSDRFEFESDIKQRKIRLGVRWEDVEAYDLDDEEVPDWKPFDDDDDDDDRIAAMIERLENDGADEDEIEYLLTGRRVELNAFSVPDFIAFVEDRLTEKGVEKLIPDEAVLREAALFYKTQADAKAWLADRPPTIPPVLPDDFAERVAAMLEANRNLAWDEAVARLVPVTKSAPPVGLPTRRRKP